MGREYVHHSALGLILNAAVLELAGKLLAQLLTENSHIFACQKLFAAFAKHQKHTGFSKNPQEKISRKTFFSSERRC